MRATGTTAAAYLRLFRSRQSGLLAHGAAREHPALVAATLGLALSRLAGEDLAAAGLLRLLAFLAARQRAGRALAQSRRSGRGRAAAG
jgi:hypothetical protein